MKKIEAIIQAFDLEEVEEALNNIGIYDINISEVRQYHSPKKTKRPSYRGQYTTDFIPRIKLEIAAASEAVENVKKVINQAVVQREMVDMVLSQCTLYESEDNKPTPKPTPAVIIPETTSSPAIPTIKHRRQPLPPKQLIPERKASAAELVWKVSKTSRSDTLTVTIISRDCSDIFSKIAGVFTLNHFDILNAKSYRQNDSALDIFTIRSFPGQPLPEQLSEDKKLIKAEADLRAVMKGSLDLDKEFHRGSFGLSGNLSRRSPKVVINNDASLLFSIIEITADDFPGLLFKVTDTLFKCGLTIRMSKITTSRSRQVVDAFYVKETDGKRISSPARMTEIKTAIVACLTSPGSNTPEFKYSVPLLRDRNQQFSPM